MKIRHLTFVLALALTTSFTHLAEQAGSSLGVVHGSGKPALAAKTLATTLILASHIAAEA